MKEYFNNGKKFLGRTPTSLPTTLNADLQTYHHVLRSAPKEMVSSQLDTPVPSELKTGQDLLSLQTLAQDRDTWKDFVKLIQQTDDVLTNTQLTASVLETA